MFNPADLVSTRIEFHNRVGKRVVGLWSSYRSTPTKAVVVIPPGYERKVRHYGVIAAFLGQHGYDTLRFDLTNHLGNSDGEIADLTMSSIAMDIEAAIDACALQNPDGLPLFVVASSLTCRAAIRVASSRPLDGMALLLPVTDVQATLTRVICEDVVSQWQTRQVTNSETKCRVVEHDVKFAFVKDLCDNHWVDPETVRREVSAIEAPVFGIGSARDDWVDQEEISAAMSGPSTWKRHLCVIETSSHEIAHNPPALRTLMEYVLRSLDNCLDAPLNPVVHFEFEQLVRLKADELMV